MDMHTKPDIVRFPICTSFVFTRKNAVPFRKTTGIFKMAFSASFQCRAEKKWRKRNRGQCRGRFRFLSGCVVIYGSSLFGSSFVWWVFKTVFLLKVFNCFFSGKLTGNERLMSRTFLLLMYWNLYCDIFLKIILKVLPIQKIRLMKKSYSILQ